VFKHQDKWCMAPREAKMGGRAKKRTLGKSAHTHKVHADTETHVQSTHMSACRQGTQHTPWQQRGGHCDHLGHVHHHGRIGGGAGGGQVGLTIL